MSRERSDTTLEDRQDDGLARAAPATSGALTLIFESGCPCAVPSFRLAELDAVTFGRGPSRVARLDEVAGERRLTVVLADRRMSIAHAQLRRVADGWSLEDASSKNGTRVNGVDLGQVILSDGDLIELGRSFFVFRETSGPPPSNLADPPPGLTTQRPELARQFANLVAVARAAVPIVVHGETGTGKELIARAIHQISGRAGPFQAVNCGALPRALVEAELFGYRKGAFSGATEDRPGLVRSADRGTLFLDEIGDLPIDSQAALLRVLQEREVTPIGGVRPISVDVRVVAATHRNLAEMAERGTFRGDLLARLTGFTVTLPPLRARREDLGALLRDLLVRHAPPHDAYEFTPDAIRAMYSWPWPGNVRELEQAVATAVVLAAAGPIARAHLPSELWAPPGGAAARQPTEAPARTTEGAALARDRLDELLTRHRGNINAVARELRTSRTQVHRLCRRFEINLLAYRAKP